MELFLKETNVNIKIKNHEGQNVVHRAAYFGELKVLKYLRKKTKINFFSKDKKGNNPIHFACLKLHIRCARYILTQTKENLLTQKNINGQTPIDILQNFFNKAKEESVPEIDPIDIRNYLFNKNEPPAIYRKSLLKIEEIPKKNMIHYSNIFHFGNIDESRRVSLKSNTSQAKKVDENEKLLKFSKKISKIKQINFLEENEEISPKSNKKATWSPELIDEKNNINQIKNESIQDNSNFKKKTLNYASEENLEYASTLKNSKTYRRQSTNKYVTRKQEYESNTFKRNTLQQNKSSFMNLEKVNNDWNENYNSDNDNEMECIEKHNNHSFEFDKEKFETESINSMNNSMKMSIKSTQIFQVKIVNLKREFFDLEDDVKQFAIQKINEENEEEND